MRQKLRHVLMGIGIGIFTFGIWMTDELPSYYPVRQIGWELVGQSIPDSNMSDVGDRIARELLGGETFFGWEDEAVYQQKMALKENRTSAGEELVADSEEAVGGDVIGEESVQTMAEGQTAVRKNNGSVEKLKNSLDIDYLWSKFYIVDSTTSVTKDLFDVKKLLEDDMTLEKKEGKKQILIYHTHGASESFADSTKSAEDSVVGVGTLLAKELEQRGYGVIHDTTKYDWIDGQLDRSLAYNKSLEGIEKIRKENPDIKVLIDLHRDSVGAGRHTYTTINGKKTAIVMFFNGMSRNRSGPIEYLKNPNLQGNLAFSLQCKCKAMEYYDGFTKPIYLKGYRYNLHLEKRSLLIELGNQNNTVEEAKNAAAPLADVLDKVLSGEE